jgi:hypothetical protein
MRVVVILGAALILIAAADAKPQVSRNAEPDRKLKTAVPPRAVVKVKVVDESGKPVEGARITPNFLGFYEAVTEWSNQSYGPPPTVKTDAEGCALVPYPIEVSEGNKTTRIGFAVDHPKFCLEYGGRSVKKDETALPAPRGLAPIPAIRDEPPIVLKRGARLEISGYMAGTKKPAAVMIAQVYSLGDSNPTRDCWKEAEPGVLRTERFPPGPRWLRVMLLPSNAPASFSDPVRLDLKAGESKHLKLKLKRGVRLEGRMDSTIPRPIHNGWVSLKIIAKSTYAERERARLEEQPAAPAKSVDEAGAQLEALRLERLRDPWDWSASMRIRKDGSFVFPSLPPGEAGIVAGCDGFLSADPANTGQKSPQELELIARQNGTMPASPYGSGRECPRNAQQIALDGSLVKFSVPTEKTGTAEFKIIDPTGQPVLGASVRFLLNWYWQGKVGWLGMEYGTAEFLRAERRRGAFPLYIAKTDAKGIARVPNLPGGQQLYRVTHPDFSPPADADLPYSEDPQCTLLIVPGEVSKRTEQLRAK